MADATIIDGRALAKRFRAEVAERVGKLRAAERPVRLDALLAADPESPAGVYAHSQGRACKQVDIDYHLHTLPPNASYDDVAGRVLLLSNDERVNAIMVHLPLPEGVDADRIQALIDSDKDVEGVNPANIGNIVYGRTSLVPCTSLAVLRMVESTGVELRGKACVVVGASNIVGKPIAVLLMREEATVVSANKYTDDLPGLTRRADVVISAAGVPSLIKKEMIKHGAVVVDVGTSRIAQPDGSMRTVGDVDFDNVKGVASHISPVPGGVGPMTVAMLLLNVVEAAELRLRLA